MSVQLYVQYPYVQYPFTQFPSNFNNNPWILLDIKPDEEPIKLNLSVADITDPLKVSSTYSRTFRVPNTQVNGNWFKSVFNVNGADFNPAALAPAYINDNGETLVNGNIRLTGIFREDQTQGIWYEVLFLGETSDFGSNINGYYMSDVDMSKYNHALSYANITNSWSGGLFNKAVRYPLVEWGYDYTTNNTGGFDPVQPTLSMLGTSGKSFTNSGYPLNQTQMKPAIQLKALWDAIIAPGVNQTGYATNSTSNITIPTFPNPVPTGFYQSITLTVGTGLQYTSNGTQKILIQFDATTYMIGNVVQYTTASGYMVVNVTEVAGSGVYNNWSVTLIQPGSLSGYTYTVSNDVAKDSFMSSDIFQNLYVLTDSQARAEFTSNQKFTAISDFVQFSSGAQYFAPNATTKFDIQRELVDEANAYYPTTSTYVTPSAGPYTFKVTLDAVVIEGSLCQPDYSAPCLIANNRCRVNIQLKANTGQVWNLNGSTPVILSNAPGTTTTVYYVQNSTPITLPAGIALTLQCQIMTPTTTYAGNGFDLNSVQWEATYTPILVNLNSFLSNQIKVIDFVKGVIDKFKLVFIPSKEKAKEFQIIPWINWVQGGRSKDWTNRLDESVEYKITPLFSGQTRNNVFKDAEDTDYLNYNYQQANNKTYGQLNLDSGNLLLTGETVRSNIFARTPLGPIGSALGVTTQNAAYAAKWLIPHIAKITSVNTGNTTANKVEPIQPKLRMVFWNGTPAIPTGSPAWYLKNDGGASMSQLTIPLVSDFQTWPFNPATLDLRWSYAPPLYDVAAQSISNPSAVGNVTAFNQYWSGWYNTVQDTYNRAVEMNLVLDYGDIKDLLFNDYIYIKDAWYFIDQINDYVVGQTTSCKVKLYKVGSTLGIVLPNGVTRLNQKTGCYHPTTDCGAVCCTNGSLSGTNFFTGVTGAPTPFSTKLYTDPFGNIPAASGKYAFGNYIWTIGSGGTVIAYGAAPYCFCGNTGGNSFRALYTPATPGDTPSLASNVLCGNPAVAPAEVNIYGQQSDTAFIDNIRFYSDSDLTQPVPDGIYYPADEGGDLAWTVNQTQVWQITDKGMCDCPSPYYQQHLAFGVDDCSACCFTSGTNTIWSDTPNIDTGTQLYADQDGTAFAVGPGFYSDGLNTYEVDAEGLVIGTGNCSGCTCGDTSNIDITYTTVNTTGFTGSLILEKSFDLFNWFYVGQVDWTPSDPEGIPKTLTFPVEINAWTRASLTSDTTNPGAMTLDYKIDGNIIQTDKVPTPWPTERPVIVTAQDQASPGPVREYLATVYQ